MNFKEHTPIGVGAMVMIAAASITHEREFHIKPKNLKKFVFLEIIKETQNKQIMKNPIMITQRIKIIWTLRILFFKFIVSKHFQPLLNFIRVQTISCTLEMVKHLFKRYILLQKPTPSFRNRTQKLKQGMANKDHQHIQHQQLL